MSEHTTAQRTTNSQTTATAQPSTAETAAPTTMDARQITSATIMQMQRTMGNRAVQGMIQRMGNGQSVVQRNGGASATPASTTTTTPTPTPALTPAQKRKEKMNEERDATVPGLVNTSFSDIKTKVAQNLEKHLTTDSKGAAIRQNVKAKVISEIKASMTSGSQEQRDDALKYAQESAEGIMIAKLKTYATEVANGEVVDAKKDGMKVAANKAYDTVTPSLNDAAFAKQKTKSAAEAQKNLNNLTKTLVTDAVTSSLAVIAAKFITTSGSSTVTGGFDSIAVGDVGTKELQERVRLDNTLVDQTVLRTETVDGTQKDIRDMENIYITKILEPLKKDVLLKLGVGRREFRRSKELNEYRQGLKDAARTKVNAQIDAEITSAGQTATGTTPATTNPATSIASSTPMKKEYMKMATKAIAYKDSKQLVDDVMAEESKKIIQALLPKDETILKLTNAGKSAAYEIARKSGAEASKIQTASIKGANALAEKLLLAKKEEAILDARKLTKGTKATAATATTAATSATTPDTVKAQQVLADIQNDDKTKAVAKAVIKKSVEAPDLNSGFNKIGKLIDLSTPNPGDASSLDFELKIPIASAAGGGHAYFLFGFGGEAEREAEDLTVNTQLTFGAGFSTFGFDANARFGLFLEGKGKDTDSVMNLLSYGLYREMNDIKPAAAAHFWGLGGRSGDSKLVEAEKWAMMIEEQHLVDEAEVSVGGLAKLAMEANVGVAEFSAELAVKRLSKYNKEIIEKKGKHASGRAMTALERLANDKNAIGKGEVNTTVEAATEIEVGFGKDKVAFGLEGSLTKTKNEDDPDPTKHEWLLKELSLQLSASIPSQFGEEGGDITKYVSKIVTAAIGGGKNLAALLKKAAAPEADRKKRATGTVLDAGSDALFTGNYFDDIGASFASKIQGDETINDTMRSWLPGQDDSASAIEQVNKIALSNALQLSVGFKKEYDGWANPGDWEISLEASQVKSLEVDAEIVKVAIEKSKRLGKLEFAKGKTTKYEGLGFAGGGQDRPTPTPTTTTPAATTGGTGGQTSAQTPSSTGTSTQQSTPQTPASTGASGSQTATVQAPTGNAGAQAIPLIPTP
ncbi:hypothetical protein A8709_18845 [Paenibacillus pectinilyticus]|uniref:Uncharacterized protein n=1 Tax=Paenibacillus pectinilyticus TaxID=512399 RepID=A0A1C0ZZT2_9BACL|nr:hypothetical protein [Paenibacillus pectinilyticus]OCT13647.1 hypothetical protein A8709_18845 [Paenibacillus pectinilyticus]